MATTETLYRRPLPPHAIAFSSMEGRQLFAEALATGGMGGYFPLAEQFHTQADPAFCGLGSLVVALNALSIDPGRLWKGPWRWFSEDLLDCCVALEEVRRRGLELDELACLARCNGADVTLARGTLAELRAALAVAASGEAVLIAAYDRSALDQTGSGHYSPIGGYHATRDLALVLDVARFKYPPHWIGVERLWAAMQPIDPASGKPRGWLLLRRRASGSALAASFRCEGETLHALAAQLRALAAQVATLATVDEVLQAVAPLASRVELRTPVSETHAAAIEVVRAELRTLPEHAAAARLDPARADTIALLALALRDTVPADRPALASELASLRAQVAALSTFARPTAR